MEANDLIQLIGKGEIKTVIDTLLQFLDSYYARFATDVLHISSRYNHITKERNAGILPPGDYNIELNSVSRSLIELVISIEGLNGSHYKTKKDVEAIREQVRELVCRYEECRKKAKTIQTIPTRLREKNEIGRKMGELFVSHPELIEAYRESGEEGVIVGLANRYRVVPDTDAIDIFESAVRNTTGNFSRGCIVNALAEIVYSGQIRIGDDARIFNLLSTLSQNADEPLLRNIQRVEADLNYLLGRMKQ
ncbi:MAG: hypothetical protein JNK89_00945 [Saprospiraceae bacterium]|nr:hypothetical protein [Saprospiraceae bacterium]